jgi:hypothetical protein
MVLVVAETDELACSERGEWLVGERSRLERGEARWLLELARFDREQGWVADGHLSAVGWLVWRTAMSRGAAFERLRIGHELWRRPVLAEAFSAGRISYSAVRAITRLDRPDADVDAALVDLAAAGTVRDLERAVRHYRLCADQDRPVDLRRLDRRGVRIRPSWDGLGAAEVILDATELEEFDAALDAFMTAQPVDDSPRDDPSATTVRAPVEVVPVWRRKADALMELVRTAVAHLGERYASGSDRYLVHIVTSGDTTQAELLDGTPVQPSEAARVACDAATVAHHHDGDGEPLRLGRLSRVWSAAQRRAITVRDGGRCRFPGCDRRVCDVHHLRPWADGGPTDIDNGLLVCTRHHTLIHEGLTATGDANHDVNFSRPDGTLIAATRPLRRFQHLMGAGANIARGGDRR